MKSKFAKFIDGTIGVLLIFFAATANFRYYTTLELAVFSGITVAACAVLVLHVTGIKRMTAQKISAAAADMFYEFMFFDERTPLKFLYTGLKAKGENVKLRGKLLYLGNVAAACFFDEKPSEKAVARTVAIAKHFGAKRAVLFCKAVPSSVPETEGFTVTCVGGDDVYRLFASLGIVPKPAYSRANKSRASKLKSALGKDKIIRYFILSSGLFFVSILSGRKLIPFVCACIGTLLCLAALIYNIVKSVKPRVNRR